MNNHKVPAQSLISWQRNTQKCEKSDSGKVKARLEKAPTPERIAGRGCYEYSSRVQATESVR
jgi:hypothetical protein